MEFFTGLLIDFYLFFLDYKFWKKKRAQRKYEKKHGLPKKTMIYPSDKISLKIFFIFFLLLIPIFFLFFRNKNQNKTENQLTKIHNILKVEKNEFNLYPLELKTIIRNNPLQKDLTIDAWNNEFFYEVSDDRSSYKLVSKGKDGIVNTEDDIK